MVSVDKIPKIMELMNRFQEENKVTGACVSNCQYLYDNLRRIWNVKVQAVIVFIPKQKRLCTGHLVLIADYPKKFCIDPSYEFNSMNQEDIHYYLSWRNFYDNHIDIDDILKKKSIQDWTYFQKIADRINSGELVVHHADNLKDVYNKQADYIEKKICTPSW